LRAEDRIVNSFGVEAFPAESGAEAAGKPHDFIGIFAARFAARVVAQKPPLADRCGDARVWDSAHADRTGRRFYVLAPPTLLVPANPLAGPAHDRFFGQMERNVVTEPAEFVIVLAALQLRLGPTELR